MFMQFAIVFYDHRRHSRGRTWAAGVRHRESRLGELIPYWSDHCRDLSTSGGICFSQTLVFRRQIIGYNARAVVVPVTAHQDTSRRPIGLEAELVRPKLRAIDR